MAKYVELPTWTYAGARQDVATLGCALALAGLENRWVKLTAAQQRAIMGRVEFGKQSVGIFDGQMMVTRQVCFGLDSDTRLVNPYQVSGR